MVRGARGGIAEIHESDTQYSHCFGVFQGVVFEERLASKQLDIGRAAKASDYLPLALSAARQTALLGQLAERDSRPSRHRGERARKLSLSTYLYIYKDIDIYILPDSLPRNTMHECTVGFSTSG